MRYPAVHSAVNERTLNPDIWSCYDGEYEQEEDKRECLQVVGGHPFYTVQDCPQQLALWRVKPVAEHVRYTPIVTGWNRIQQLTANVTCLGYSSTSQALRFCSYNTPIFNVTYKYDINIIVLLLQ